MPTDRTVIVIVTTPTTTVSPAEKAERIIEGCIQRLDAEYIWRQTNSRSRREFESHTASMRILAKAEDILRRALPPGSVELADALRKLKEIERELF
jgi:hypothetical protein